MEERTNNELELTELDEEQLSAVTGGVGFFSSLFGKKPEVAKNPTAMNFIQKMQSGAVNTAFKENRPEDAFDYTKHLQKTNKIVKKMR